MKATSKRRDAVVVVLAAVLVGVLMFWSAGPPHFESSSNVRRTWAADAYDLQPPSAPRTPRPISSIDLKVVKEKGEMYWAWPETAGMYALETEPWIPPVIKADEQQVLRLPEGGTIRVLFAAMGYNPDLDEQLRDQIGTTEVLVRGSDWKPINLREFHALQEEALGEVRWEDWVLSRHDPKNFSLELVLVFEDVPDVSGIVEDRVWDRQTGVGLDRGRGTRTSLDDGNPEDSGPVWIAIRYQLKCLHDARASLGVDFGYGPLETQRVPAKVGSRILLSDLEGEVVAMEHEAARTISLDLNTGVVAGSHALKFTLVPSDNPPTLTGISLSPACLTPYVDIGYSDFLGKDYPPRRRTRGIERLSRLATPLAPDELKEILVSYQPNQVRAVFELPPLLGVPAGNEEVDNLFDVTVPYASCANSNSISGLMGDVAQVGVYFKVADEAFPEGYFPRVFRNETVGEILQEYLAFHDRGGRVRMSQVYHLYESGPSPVAAWMQRQGKRIQKWFSRTP